MGKKNFLLLSLGDDKAKKIANVVSNSSCKKILDLLAEKDYTETELSKKLNVPISTVHYNLKQLIESKLIEGDKYHYSEKGKEVKHYSLANKYIIIAPKDEDKSSIIDALKSIIPIFVLGIVGTFLVNSYNKVSSVSSFSMERSVPMMADSFDEMASTKMVNLAAEPVVNNVSYFSEPAIYFALGFALALIFVLVSFLIKNKVFKKRK